MYYNNSNITYNDDNTATTTVINLSTTPYTMPITSTILICDASSNAIIITLPTAVGIQGTFYKIIRTDTTLANKITINTTSSQTIGVNVTTRSMWTANEVWELESDGANWQIINHFAKTSFTTMTPATTSTGASQPVYGGGTFVNEMKWKREGKHIMVVYQYRQTTSGTNGLGDYLFNIIPSGITIDTSITGTYTTIEGSDAWKLNDALPSVLLGNAALAATIGGICVVGVISVYSTTQVRLFTVRKSSPFGVVCSDYFNMGGTFQISFSCMIPITEFDE
jgi:hypothetical protein